MSFQTCEINESHTPGKLTTPSNFLALLNRSEALQCSASRSAASPTPNPRPPPTDLRTQSAALGAAQDTNEWTASAFLATPNPSEARLRRASRPASARPPAISRPAYSTSTSRWPSRTHSFVSTSIRSRGPDSQDSLPDRQNRTMHALRTPAVALMRDSTSLWEIGLPGVASAKHRGMMSSLSRPTTSGAA